MRMGRVVRRVRNQAGNTPTHQCGSQNAKSNRKVEDSAKNVCHGIVLKEAVIELEDIRKSPHRFSNRRIFDDKTNKSSILYDNKGKLPSPGTSMGKTKSLKITKKTRPLSNMTENNIENTSPSSDQKSVDGKVKYHKELQQSENIEKSMASSSSLSHTCVYTKIQRETIKNKNMAIEEKLAQYDFEVDENEPVVKKKKKKNVKCKKKINLNSDEYHPHVKVVIKEVRQLHHRKDAQKVENMPKKVLMEQNIKSVSSRKISVNDKSVSYKNMSAEYSSPISLINEDNPKDFLKNISPISQSKSHKTLEKQAEISTGKEVSEMEISGNANDCQFDVSFSMNTPKRLCSPSKQMTQESPILKETKTIENSTIVDRSFNENLISTVDDKPKCVNVVGACGTPTKIKQYVRRVLEQKVAPTPFGVCLLNRTADVSNPSLNNSHIHKSIFLPQKVHVVPRVSGGMGGPCDKTSENWSVENCFGFEDCNDKIESPPPQNKFLRLQSRTSLPLSSTPVVSNGKKELVREYFKRKLDLLDEPCEKSLETAVPDAKTRKLSNENLLSSTTIFSPSANPLKQSKLDFMPSCPQTPVNERRGQDNGSPLLFKEPEDNTPIHFKEPPRRSYVRSIRKKLKPVGDDWIEIDSDPEEQHENKRDTKKGKKGKLSKQEEKEAKKWMKEFNNECGKIEDFELCVE